MGLVGTCVAGHHHDGAVYSSRGGDGCPERGESAGRVILDHLAVNIPSTVVGEEGKCFGGQQAHNKYRLKLSSVRT